MQSDELIPWMVAKLKESNCQAKQKDGQRMNIVQRSMQKSTERIIVPVEGQGEVTLSFVCPHCHRYPREDCIWWYAACGSWRNPNRVLVTQDSTNRSETGVLRAHAPRKSHVSSLSAGRFASWR